MDMTQRHHRAGKPFDLTNAGTIASMLDDPQSFRLRGVDPAQAVQAWRRTGDRHAAERGGLIFVGETRDENEVVRHYARATWWRRLWFAMVRAKEEGMVG